MAKKFSFGQIIKKGDAKQRILLIVVVVFVLLLVLLLLNKFIHLSNNAAGDSQVSGVPSIASVQGGKVSPEYARALDSSNAQKVDYAKSTGSSTIPTLINTGIDNLVSTQTVCSNCCNTCGGESVSQILGTLLNSGQISSATADLLHRLANQNLSPEDYEAAIAQMVREGKISPQEARRLLEVYQQSYKDKIANAGAADLDPLMKAGKLSVSAASDLLALQQQPASLAAYEQTLEDRVRKGQISRDTAKLLLQKYQKQQAKRQAEESAGQLASMENSGSLSHDTAAMLAALQASDLSASDYAAAVDKLVREGKISLEEARRLLAQYNKLRGISSKFETDSLSGMELAPEQGRTLKGLQRANQSVTVFAAQLEQYARVGEISVDTATRLLAAYQVEYNLKQTLLAALSQAVAQNKVEANISTKIQALISDNVALDQFSTTLTALNNQGLFSSAQVNLLIEDYAKENSAASIKDQLMTTLEAKPKLPNDAAQKLNTMRNSSVPLTEYASELQRMVDAGLISPETARALLNTYKQQIIAKDTFATGGDGVSFAGLSSPAIDVNLGGGNNAKLDRVSQAGYAKQAALTGQRQDYTAAVAFQQQSQHAMLNQQAQIQQLSDQMYAQAQQLFTPILTPAVQVVVTANDNSAGVATGVSTNNTQDAQNPTEAYPIIKAGSILYAVLDTAVNSDYPDSPVMATVVAGTYKGAKLLGSIKTAKGGQRVMLTFNLMTMQEWPTGASVNAYAIDPDSARSAVATSVNNHYMLRYGTLFASSFLQGLGQAVQDSGTTVSSDSGVVTQSTASLNTQETILVALGQVGQNASTEVGKLQNTPPTVKIKAGIGIGVLFMSDVSAVKGAPSTTQGVE